VSNYAFTNSVEISGERPARDAASRGDRPYSMKIIIAYLENDSSVEDRLDRLLASDPVGIPQLKLSSVLWLPALIQIDQHDNSPQHTGVMIGIAIGVDIESPALTNHVEAGSREIRIWQQCLDACALGEKI
jgi:hypothetical protein